MSGFIALHREAKEHPLFAGEAARFGAWFWMVATACWKPTRFSISGATITLERGQLCVSRAQLATAWGWSPSAVERFLTRLQTEQMIERATGQGRTIITICNYDKYQDFGEQPGQATGQATGQRSDSHRTTKEQGNKGTIEEEPNGSPSNAGDAGEDLFGGQLEGGKKPAAKSKPSAKVKRQPADPLPDWIPLPAWEGFLEMRKENGKSPTPRAIELLITKLEKLRSNGHDPGAVLDQSTLNNWTGIFELKDQANGNRNQNDWRSTAGNSGPTRVDGFTAAINEAVANSRSGAPAGEARRYDAGSGDGVGELRPARRAIVR